MIQGPPHSAWWGHWTLLVSEFNSETSMIPAQAPARTTDTLAEGVMSHYSIPRIPRPGLHGSMSSHHIQHCTCHHHTLLNVLVCIRIGVRLVDLVYSW